jgi:hypothetical protein
LYLALTSLLGGALRMVEHRYAERLG